MTLCSCRAVKKYLPRILHISDCQTNVFTLSYHLTSYPLNFDEPQLLYLAWIYTYSWQWLILSSSNYDCLISHNFIACQRRPAHYNMFSHHFTIVLVVDFMSFYQIKSQIIINSPLQTSSLKANCYLPT